MTLLFLAGIYFFARGVFALYGQTIFYTKRVLENIESKGDWQNESSARRSVRRQGVSGYSLSRQSPHSVWMAADFAALRIFHFQNRYKI